MPSPEERDPHKAQDQEAERKRLAEQKSADEKGAVKEPESASHTQEAGKIIGNG
ncbi:hypothetical protein [Rhizobium sp. Root1220]|uniref:hypothetical protein n=1 Tax=Rhizobium sp. Root1220 TaxID=1736432 RepID=UPI000B295116|nr:hypothetical protein [Rhizobium sp. Root1220]